MYLKNLTNDSFYFNRLLYIFTFFKVLDYLKLHKKESNVEFALHIIQIQGFAVIVRSEIIYVKFLLMKVFLTKSFKKI